VQGIIEIWLWNRERYVKACIIVERWSPNSFIKKVDISLAPETFIIDMAALSHENIWKTVLCPDVLVAP
jgi:hypothetical protein